MSLTQLDLPVKPKRRFLPEDFFIDSWEKVMPYYERLKNDPIDTITQLQEWLLNWSELDAVLSEDMAWRYIKMTCDTTSEELLRSYTFFVQEIQPHLFPYTNTFNKKLLASPALNHLEGEAYAILLRNIKKEIAIYSEKNIPLFTEESTLAQKYGAIAGSMTVAHNGSDITMQRAASLLRETDRNLRETIWHKIQDRKAVDETALNELLSQLITIRNQVAINTGFKNYRDYKFIALGRFDYGVADCLAFHESIAEEVVPLLAEFDINRKQKLAYPELKPWDGDVDITGKPPLKPFATAEELIDKSVRCFSRINDYAATCLRIMKAMHHLDLDSRKGKAPGGYNYPLYETGVPFIFMNAVGSLNDVVTMVHEGGHAVHSFLTKDLSLTEFKNLPSEVAELASMSMELISMEHWGEFFTDTDDLKRAKRQQLEKILSVLPWIALVDKFQHWIYENPAHTATERMQEWERLSKKFSTNIVDYTGYERIKARSWQSQLHIFEVPFYYIEYGFAQLGAIAVWRNYKQNPEKALRNYMDALKLGQTKTIPEIYKTANIQFNFSKEYVKELVDFVKEELRQL
jgi:oligoendopeptidase F